MHGVSLFPIAVFHAAMNCCADKGPKLTWVPPAEDTALKEFLEIPDNDFNYMLKPADIMEIGSIPSSNTVLNFCRV